MQVGIPRETLPGETRVAATPETVKKLAQAGHQVRVERGAGTAARYLDADYEKAGAELTDADAALGSELVLKVRRPDAAELSRMKPGAALLGMLDPFDADGLKALAGASLTAFALEAAPRTTRAQSLDVLSSQANLAGYKAVLLATQYYGRIFPMMMTAAGTLKAARVVVLGAGVAGLQAIATARRLGAVVEASDVRPAAREQVESLGGKFIDVPYETDEEREIAEGVGGYARPMPAAWMARQAALVAERCKQADIVITTALIPGRPAPTLIQPDTVTAMKPGSVIVDLAVERGGNCPLSVPGEVVERDGVTLVNIGVGPSNAKNITDHLAVLRPNCWLMVGHCGGLRQTQIIGDYVLAHAYLRQDHILDELVPPEVPIPALAEVQVALQQAAAEITGEKGDRLKQRLRTGTVVTQDDRNWELQWTKERRRINLSRAIAVDMESGTIAAQGYRLRVPYGTLLCVSDKPLHGEIKLPGAANAFYERAVGEHLRIGLAALGKLKEAGSAIHSRKLRSFDEPPFR